MENITKSHIWNKAFRFKSYKQCSEIHPASDILYQLKCLQIKGCFLPHVVCNVSGINLHIWANVQLTCQLTASQCSL